jgi:hypothetical protein
MPFTPPSSPSSSRDAARHLERSNRVIGSPENRRIPTGPSVPSTFTPFLNQDSFRGPPANITTQLPSIPPQHHQNGPHPSTSAIALAPAAIITSMAAPAPPSHRQTLSSAQLAAAYAALPPLNPPRPRLASTLAPAPIITSMAAPAPSSMAAPAPPFMAAPAPPSNRQTLSSAQLMAAYAALPSLNPQSRFRSHAVSV